MSEEITSAFNPQSLGEWKSAAERELRGKSLEAIDWDFEGLNIGPYHNSRPETSLFNIRKIGEDNDWMIRQDFRGAQAVELARLAAEGGTQVVGLDSHNLTAEVLDELAPVFAKCNTKLAILGSRDQEVLNAVLTRESDLGVQLLWEIDASELDAIDDAYYTEGRYTPSVVINTQFGVNDSGADVLFELALALALGHHHLATLIEGGRTLDEAAAMISFKLGVRGTYLAESCKWRVFRRLWASIVTEYGPESHCSINTRITANLSTWNKTVIDVDGNLIRQSAEAMAAAIGGADVILIPPYDHIESRRSARLSRNIHHLLKGESWLTHVKDPIAGSYFLEEFSEKMADAVWAKFKNLDAQYKGLMLEGGLRDILDDQRNKSVDRLTNQEEVRIGGNKYQPADIQSVAPITTSTSAWETQGTT